MARILGVEEVVKALHDRAEKIGGKPLVGARVGYSAGYAAWVHENIEMKGKGQPRRSGRGNYWDPAGKGQAKFLEEPARTMAKQLAEIVRTALIRGATMIQAVFMAGLRLQRESQLRCPVDSGNLKASAFTKIEES